MPDDSQSPAHEGRARQDQFGPITWLGAHKSPATSRGARRSGVISRTTRTRPDNVSAQNVSPRDATAKSRNRPQSTAIKHSGAIRANDAASPAQSAPRRSVYAASHANGAASHANGAAAATVVRTCAATTCHVAWARMKARITSASWRSQAMTPSQIRGSTPRSSNGAQTAAQSAVDALAPA